MKPGSLITGWIRNVAPLFKALDPNHMLTTGGEAFRTEGPVVPLQSWLNTGGNVGARFAPSSTIAISNIQSDGLVNPGSS